MKRVAVLEYGMGNVRSMFNALEKLAAAPTLTADADKLSGFDAIVLPGVGAFGQGMENLRARGLDAAIVDCAKAGMPILGVCLGMQMLLETSTEFGAHEGLGLVPGGVEKLAPASARLPHIGWNTVLEPHPGRWPGTPLRAYAGEEVYFIHSFAAVPANAQHVLAEAEYDGVRFCAAIGRENIVGMQFHPEKSRAGGLSLLGAFLEL
ncbi:MAG: imidazole glycerol phosphate synthase subunit HisH [Sandaracinaceae bacterium]|nr:imidazole glycerol phosphate synthase subunit HisH [Sandaracinaceae bacterium]